jgi:hypothetical protein
VRRRAINDRVCDAALLSGQTCQSQASTAASRLRADCGSFDTSGCFNDRSAATARQRHRGLHGALLSARLPDAGFDGGISPARRTALFDTSGCYNIRVRRRAVNGPEVCDGALLADERA